jgi:hypothetical protein
VITSKSEFPRLVTSALAVLGILVILSWAFPWISRDSNISNHEGSFFGQASTSEVASTVIRESSTSISSAPESLAIYSPATGIAPARIELLHPVYRALEELLLGEPIDSEWAVKVESEIYGELAASPLEVFSVDVICRTTICRMDIVINPEVRGDDERRYDHVLIEDVLQPVFLASDGRLNSVTGGVSDEGIGTLYLERISLPTESSSSSRILVPPIDQPELRGDAPVENAGITASEAFKWDEEIQGSAVEPQEVD